MRRLIAAAAGLGLVTAGLMIPARADVSPATTTPPYTGTEGQSYCDAPAGTCTGGDSGDAATGSLINSWTATSPNDGLTPGHARAVGNRWMWADLTLDAPAGAVVLTYRVHINQASASTTNPVGGTAQSQLMYGAAHLDCAGSGCFLTAVDPLVSTDGPTSRENEDVVRTIRLVNQSGGNIPAGTVRATFQTYGGAAIGDYETDAAGSSSLVTDLVWTSLEATAEPAGPEVPPPPPIRYISVTRPYIGGTNPATDALGLPCSYALPLQPTVGGACFRVPFGSSAAEIAIGDALVMPVGGTVSKGPGNSTGFCGTSERIALPLGQQDLAVRVDNPLESHCLPGYFGTVGVITVTFEVRTPPV